MVKFTVRGVLVSLVVMASWCAAMEASAQGRVFYEPGDGSSAPNDCRSTAVSRDGVAHRNGAALECNWDGVVPWSDPRSWTGIETSVRGAERLVSAWFRIDADTDRTIGSKLMRLGFQSPHEILIVCQFELSPATILVGVNNYPTYWGSPAGACHDGKWHRLRVYAGPSLIRVWLDNTLLREWSGAFTVGDAFWVMSNWSSNPGWEHDANNHAYWDDVEVFSTDGTGGVGSMRDGTMTQGGPPPPPPAPVDCAGTWGAWSRVAGSESACSANATRTFTESRLFTASRTPENGGAACPVSPESRSVTENCVPPVSECVSSPLVVTGVAWPGTAEGTRSGRFTFSVAGVVVTLQSATFEHNPTRLVVTDSRGCTATVTR